MRSYFIRPFVIVLLVSFLWGNYQVAPAAPQAPWQAKVDTSVLQKVAQAKVEFLVYMQAQADLSGAAVLSGRKEKGAYVYGRLVEVAQRSQAPILSLFEAQGVEYRSYWVANMIWVEGDLATVQALAQNPGVARLYANPAVQFPQAVMEILSGPDSASAGVEWNVAKIGAPQVWAAGYSGQGAVIGGQDTGYEWGHPALKDQYRGWDGSKADHNYNWHDAIHTSGGRCLAESSEPCDDHGHGTHTMGTMVGDDGAGNQIGVAPGARWIGCRNMHQGVGTPATYSECYQWFLAPTDLNGQNPRPDLAPDVINNSWGCPDYEGCDQPDILRQVVENVRAAGILAVQSAGNSGPGCGTVDVPAAIYEASFSVGNTDSEDRIASSSSRGPVFVDGSGRLKPDVSAPGSSIRSSILDNGYSILSGTSMAAPHVSGLAALMLSARPDFSGRVEDLEFFIQQSSVPVAVSVKQICGGVSSDQTPNNTFGWGRIDARAALQAILETSYYYLPAILLRFP